MTGETLAQAGTAARIPKRQRTKTAIIAAAVEIVGERGFEGLALEAVARRAGRSRGAIYGNFDTREDLLLEVARSVWRPILPSPAPGQTLRERMRGLAEAVAAQADERRKLAVGSLSFRLFVLKHPEMRKRVLAASREAYAAAVEQVLMDVDEAELPMPAVLFVRVVHATIEGLLMTSFLTPELITREVMVAAMDNLAGAGGTLP
jgi:AcrR family transcriptional regulator